MYIKYSTFDTFCTDLIFQLVLLHLRHLIDYEDSNIIIRLVMPSRVIHSQFNTSQ